MVILAQDDEVLGRGIEKEARCAADPSIIGKRAKHRRRRAEIDRQWRVFERRSDVGRGVLLRRQIVGDNPLIAVVGEEGVEQDCSAQRLGIADHRVELGLTDKIMRKIDVRVDHRPRPKARTGGIDH